MDNIPEKKTEQQDSQPGPLQSEAGSALATDAKWNNNTAAKELLAAMPNLEVLGSKARDTNTNSATALDKAANELKKGKFSEYTQSMLKNSFEFSPDALQGIVKDLNRKLKPVGEEIKIHSNPKDAKPADTFALTLCDKKGKTLDSIALGGSPKTDAPPPAEALRQAPMGAAAPNFAPREAGLPVAGPDGYPKPQVYPVDRRGPMDGGPAIDPVYPPENRYDRVLTGDGPTILAKAGDTIWAGRGDVVWAYMGSNVHAEAGAKVRAFDGSVVNCYPGSDVHIYAGSRCQIDKGTMVNFEYVGSWQNRRFPEGANVMANQRNYYVPFGQIIGNVYGPFYVKP